MLIKYLPFIESEQMFNERGEQMERLLTYLIESLKLSFITVISATSRKQRDDNVNEAPIRFLNLFVYHYHHELLSYLAN
jgi:hypothetical protein